MKIYSGTVRRVSLLLATGYILSFTYPSSFSFSTSTDRSLSTGNTESASFSESSSSRSPEDIEFIIDDSVLIRTRDSAIISAMVVRKKGADSPQPVILTFTIYPQFFDQNIAKTLARWDFVGVVAYTRGKRLSPQEIEPFEHDGDDAYDIIDWISKQPWCNGKIGMYGGSYGGFSTWAATKTTHPALKTIVPIASVAPGIDMPMFNGVFRNYSLEWLNSVTISKMHDFKGALSDKKWDSIFRVWYHKGNSFRSLDTVAERPDKIFQRWLQHPLYDQYWRQMIPQKEAFAHINIPVLTITGYYDGDQVGALHYFNEHHKYNRNADHYLIIGPYDHSGIQLMAKWMVDRYAIDSVARIVFFPTILREWLNYTLKDSSKPSLLKNKINYQIMGTNKWRHVGNMNEISNDTLIFYLGNAHSGIHYKLLPSKPVKEGSIKTVVDFTKRSPQEKNWKIIDSSFNQYDYLSFISDPVDEPLIVSGRYFADLSFVINKKDVDIEMEMLELTPDGKFFLLSTEYFCRASFKKNPAKRQLLQPGKKERVELRNTFFTSKQLSKGSRFVILLGVPNRMDWQINYGSGKDVSDETVADGQIPLEIKWLSSSRISIPVYKENNFR